MNILHVVATTQRRGGEIFAAALVRSLADLGAEQRVAVLRSVGEARVTFDAPTAMLPAAGRLRGAVDHHRPDVVQAHGGEALKAAMRAGLDVPVVYRRIGGVPPWLETGPRRWWYARMMRRTAAVVTVADSLREETMRVFRLPPGKVVTIPNAVDLEALAVRRDRMAVREELDIAPDACVTVSIGALVPEKDPLRVLDTLEPFLRQRPDAVHLFVGDGPLRDAMQARAASASLGGRVKCLGERPDVGDILEASDVAVFASPPGAMEGMPASLIEAGLCGLPIVGFDVAGAREVVEDGVTGFVVPWGDTDAFLARLGEVLEDPSARRAMGEAAADRCTRFDIRAVAPRYLALYREVAA
jgi:glycosyltransferase involved in cell wall biosynthesis